MPVNGEKGVRNGLVSKRSSALGWARFSPVVEEVYSSRTQWCFSTTKLVMEEPNSTKWLHSVGVIQMQEKLHLCHISAITHGSEDLVLAMKVNSYCIV